MKLRLETREVLAAAYQPFRKKATRLLRHGVLVDEFGALVAVLCRRVSIDSLADRNAGDPTEPPTCDYCIRKVRKAKKDTTP